MEPIQRLCCAEYINWKLCPFPSPAEHMSHIQKDIRDWVGEFILIKFGGWGNFPQREKWALRKSFFLFIRVKCGMREPSNVLRAFIRVFIINEFTNLYKFIWSKGPSRKRRANGMILCLLVTAIRLLGMAFVSTKRTHAIHRRH